MSHNSQNSFELEGGGSTALVGRGNYVSESPLVRQKNVMDQIGPQFTAKRLGLLIISVGLSVVCELRWKPTLSGVHDDERWKPYFVISTVLFAVLLITDDLAADGVLLAVAILYIFTGIITQDDAFSGFGNSGVVAYAGLFAVSSAFQEVRVLEPILGAVLGRPKSFIVAQLRLAVPVCILSAFFNNGPVVAMVVPVLEGWAQRCGYAASQFLMPLAFASTLGGTLTTIGSAANLVAVSIAEKLPPPLGPVEILFFDLMPVGACTCAVGILYMLIAAPFLLSDNTGSVEEAPTVSPCFSTAHLEEEEDDEEATNFEILFNIQTGCSLVGASLMDAGVPRMPGVQVVSLSRSDTPVAPAATTVLCAEDVVKVRATPGGIKALRTGFAGFVPSMHHELAWLGARRRKRQLVEAVVSNSSPLLAQPLDSRRLVNEAGMVLLALRRNWTAGIPREDTQRICAATYDKFQLCAGDVLLIEAFLDKLSSQRRYFSLVKAVSDSKPPRTGRMRDALRAMFCLVGLLTMVLLSALNIFELAPMVLTIVLLCCIGKVYDWPEARQSVNGSVMITIAASFALSAAMKKSGAATAIASAVVSLGIRGGDFGVSCAVYVATACLSNIISNTATAVMMIPIAVDVAQKVALNNGTDPKVKPFVILIVFAANAAFATPIATPCNMLVIDAGGYKFVDFLRFGLPLQFLMLITTCLAVAAVY